MPPLPVVSGMQARAVFEKHGWRYARSKGSHMMLVKPGVRINLAVPDRREIDSGLLRRLIRDSGLSVEQLLADLK